MKSLFGMKLISWTAAPANAGTLSFRRGETGRRLLVKDDGVYPAPRGFIMIVRWPVMRLHAAAMMGSKNMVTSQSKCD